MLLGLYNEYGEIKSYVKIDMIEGISIGEFKVNTKLGYKLEYEDVECEGIINIFTIGGHHFTDIMYSKERIYSGPDGTGYEVRRVIDGYNKKFEERILKILSAWGGVNPLNG